MDWLIDEFKKDTGIDLRKDKMALQRLKDAAEKAKIELSSDAGDHHQPAVPHRRRDGPKHLDMKLARQARAAMIEPSSSARWSPAQGARRRGQERPSDIDEVVLVGGSTRIPLVQER
jgi:molecular chaperone DnaK